MLEEKLRTSQRDWEQDYAAIWTEMLGAPYVQQNVQVLNWFV